MGASEGSSDEKGEAMKELTVPRMLLIVLAGWAVFCTVRDVLLAIHGVR